MAYRLAGIFGEITYAIASSFLDTALKLFLFKLSSRLNQSPPAASPRAAPAVPAARPQPPVLSVPCGADRRPAGDRQGVRRGVCRPPPARGGRGGRWKRPFNFPILALRARGGCWAAGSTEGGARQ